MPLLKIKLFSNNNAASLQTAIAALQVAVGSTQLATDQRGQDLSVHREKATGLTRLFAALAFDGTDMPATKTADQQFLVVQGRDLVSVQAELDAALADAKHHVRADGNADTNPGDINVGAAMFAVGDVGRKITIGTNERTITAYTSATRVTYSGAAITGTGLAVILHGAESLAKLDVGVCEADDGSQSLTVLAAVEGQVA